MEITLIRHGTSSWTENRPMTCLEFNKWVETYDAHGVAEEMVYPTETLAKMETAHLFVTSDLRRSIESANLLKPDAETLSDPLFRETELPLPGKNLFGLKLPANWWLVLLRVLWFCGYSRGCESFNAAGERAAKAADELINWTEEHGHTILVGHGFFNNLIAKELLKRGWEGKRRTSSKHWHSTTYTFSQQELS